MKIYLVGSTRQKESGGGFTFIRNIQKALPDMEFVNTWQNADIYFISGCTLINRDELALAKRSNKPIIFRVDNLPKQSTNRNTAFTNLRLCGAAASYIVYQSEWAREYVGWCLRDLHIRSKVILNGADEEIYNTNNAERIISSYLFINRKGEENKRWPEAKYEFTLASRGNPDSVLRLVGEFPQEVVRCNFDFVDGELFSYFGKLPPERMAELYKSTETLLAPYFMDACSNTIIEARLSGCKIWTGVSGMTGGDTRDIKRRFK